MQYIQYIYTCPSSLLHHNVNWTLKSSDVLHEPMLCAVWLFVASILQGLCNNGAIPLFYELAIEATYPVTEVCISTVMTLVYNTLPLLFLVIFLIPNVGMSLCISNCALSIISSSCLLIFAYIYTIIICNEFISWNPLKTSCNVLIYPELHSISVSQLSLGFNVIDSPLLLSSRR